LIGVNAHQIDRRRGYVSQLFAQFARQAIHGRFARLAAAPGQYEQRSGVPLPAQQDFSIAYGKQADFVKIHLDLLQNG